MRYTVTGIWERPLINGKFAYYLQVEQKLNITGRVEEVWINPFSIPEDLDTSKSKVGDIIEIDDKRFIDENAHAVACRCTKCTGIFKRIMKKAEEQGTVIIDTGGKTADEVAKELSRITK